MNYVKNFFTNNATIDLGQNNINDLQANMKNGHDYVIYRICMQKFFSSSFIIFKNIFTEFTRT